MKENSVVDAIERALGRELSIEEKGEHNSYENLSEKDISELRQLKSISASLPVAFLKYKLKKTSVMEATKFITEL